MSSKLGLSARDRRTLTIGSFAITSLVVVARGIPALRSWDADRKAEAYSAAQQLASLRDGLVMLPTLRDSLRVRRARLAALESDLLFGASPSAIAANLASELEDLADDNAVKVTALQLRADTVAIGGLAHVDVRLTGIADVYGLAGFLRAAESDSTLLVVRDLSVSQAEPTAADGRPEALRVDMLVAAIGTMKNRASVRQ
jgi:hypothetical protein